MLFSFLITTFSFYLESSCTTVTATRATVTPTVAKRKYATFIAPCMNAFLSGWEGVMDEGGGFRYHPQVFASQALKAFKG